MNVELTLAMEIAEDHNEQRRLTRNNVARKQTVINLVNGLSSYVISERKNATECDVSNSETLSASKPIDTTYDNYDIDFDLISPEFIENTEADDSNDDTLNDNFNLINELILSHNKQVALPLHPYTNISTKEFCTNLLRAFRQTKLCKTYSTNMLKLIGSGLPQPNNLPTSLNSLLRYMNVENLFTKRKVCLSCQSDIEYSARFCLKCKSTDKIQFANIYDIDYAVVFSEIVERNIVDIKIYRSFLKTVIHQPFISTLIHLDGIPLAKSSKLTLWLLSCSILELPPHLRNQRENMIILSMWIGFQQPLIKTWLRECIPSLNQLKSSGMQINRALLSTNS
ncbi:unnamed protein product [Adineta steineri]|uniref:Uncharacterized protein n=3 Tax=Adineta steineri TaxID=433720 RepID=A0A819Z4J4_9BILA|nr:unnamed protein product [Adineta steineri]